MTVLMFHLFILRSCLSGRFHFSFSFFSERFFFHDRMMLIAGIMFLKHCY